MGVGKRLRFSSNSLPFLTGLRGDFLANVLGKGGRGARQMALKRTRSSPGGTWTATIILFNGSPLGHTEPMRRAAN